MQQTRTDALFSSFDTALRTLFVPPRSARPTPQPTASALTPGALTPEQKQLSAALMRVNHVGEVCAQALYTAQALTTPNPQLRAHFTRACVEETDHLAWTQERLKELGSRTSLLNPLWYLGAFGLGLLAGRLGNAVSLGFVVETENQVEAHLESHLALLPEQDQASRAIVAQMMTDEAQHAKDAQVAGAMELPTPVKNLMRAAAKVMTTTAHYI
jgi:ubiquinone biosynthesis monooxygenase Coq7